VSTRSVGTAAEGVRSERALEESRGAAVCITKFTDPGCPWAWSAEPFRWRLEWLYGSALDWKLRMVVLSERAQDNIERGFTPEMLAEASAQIARDHRMPIDTRLRPRMPATLPACRAVVATRVHAPQRAQPLLRALQIRNFSGELFDEPEAIEGAARDVGIAPDELFGWERDPAVLEELEQDMRLARQPLPAARVLDHKLANWSGGRRYTCPSYELVRRADDVRIAVPGFQPFAAYDVITANLAPGLDRRPPPSSVEEVLRWAGEPLATQEVAVVCDIPFEEARAELGRVAVERHVGADGLWSLSAPP
jgi:protein-disulfide isomerase-like protein with CxxC motif